MQPPQFPGLRAGLPGNARRQNRRICGAGIGEGADPCAAQNDASSRTPWALALLPNVTASLAARDCPGRGGDVSSARCRSGRAGR